MRSATAVVAFVVVLAALAAPAAARDWHRLEIGTDGAYPPFSELGADGRPTGFDVEVAQVLCARLGAECRITALGWDGLVPGLLARRVDLLIASQPITDEARRRVEFTSKYHQIRPRFVARDRDAPSDVTPAALKGKRIGVRTGTVHAAWVAATCAPAGATAIGFPSEAEAGDALAEGRVDIVFGDTPALFDWLEHAAPDHCCGFVGAEVAAPRFFGEGAGIAFRREDRDLGVLVEQALAEIGRDGTLDRIAGHWFPFALR